MMQVGKALAKITGRTGLKVRKYSPEILIIGGVIGGVTAAVMAVGATASPKYLEIRAWHQEALDNIKSTIEFAEQNPIQTHEDGTEEPTYSPAEIKQDKFIVYRKTTVDLAKIYWPSVTLGALSIVAILGGFRIIRRRNVALMAAYNFVDRAFKDYRGRVVNELGKDADTRFMYDTETRTEHKTIMNPDGTTKKIKTSEQVLKGTTVSMYGRLFDKDTTHQWSSVPGYNWLYLKKKKDYLNDKLRMTGHVFLNEVYEELGFDHTPAGAVVGWVKNGNDGYISFGPWCEDITEVEAEGRDGNILVDFNVDGVIWDLI